MKDAESDSGELAGTPRRRTRVNVTSFEHNVRDCPSTMILAIRPQDGRLRTSKHGGRLAPAYQPTKVHIAVNNGAGEAPRSPPGFILRASAVPGVRYVRRQRVPSGTDKGHCMRV